MPWEDRVLTKLLSNLFVHRTCLLTNTAGVQLETEFPALVYFVSLELCFCFFELRSHTIALADFKLAM